VEGDNFLIKFVELSSYQLLHKVLYAIPLKSVDSPKEAIPGIPRNNSILHLRSIAKVGTNTNYSVQISLKKNGSF
jgi:hypothetical protein